MIITIIGWITVFIILVLLALLGYSEIVEINIRKANKRYYKNLDKFADRINGHRHWLNSPERLPYRDLFTFIVDGLRKGHISGEALREKVDEIIAKGNQ